MSDQQQGPGGPRGPDVGNVAEEAAKLFGALSGWAHEQAADQTGEPDPAAAGDLAATAGAAAQGLADALGGIVGNVNEHLATGGADCRFCPVCQVIHAVRETSPEVRQQLSLALSSLLRAAAGLLATHTSRSEARGVEKIDLSDDAPWDDER
ncbi:MAG: hypothetical protein ABI873_02160 [Marmoricola sp.]